MREQALPLLRNPLSQGGAPLERKLLEEAADWLVRMKMESPSPRDEAALAAWIARSEQHGRAWTLAQSMLRQLDELPAELAVPALKRPAQRRRAIRRLALLMGLGLAGGAAVQQSLYWRSPPADLSTATGKRRQQTLADGTLLDLNTDTQVDIRYGDSERLVKLLHGEILIRTGRDAAARPFIVETPQGRIRALGTRFSVRDDGEGETRVIVFEDVVEISPAAAPVRRVASAQQLRFSAAQTGPLGTPPPHEDAWTRGLRVAVDERLQDLLDDFGRYQRGLIVCDPAVANLRVTGSYDLNNIPQAIASLQDSHPVSVQFLTRFLIRVTPSPGSDAKTK